MGLRTVDTKSRRIVRARPEDSYPGVIVPLRKITTVLSASAFCTIAREFSPPEPASHRISRAARATHERLHERLEPGTAPP